jgi:hypothetical protein
MKYVYFTPVCPPYKRGRQGEGGREREREEEDEYMNPKDHIFGCRNHI